MVGRNKNVSQILIPESGTTILGVGQPVSSLALGQMGIFDKLTGLSINVAGAPGVRNFFIAVARSKNGTAVIDKMDWSAGQEIQKSKIDMYTFREHSAGRNQVVVVSDYKTVGCDTEYCVKIEYRNDAIREHRGFVDFTKTYTVRTSCCKDCADCPSADGNEVSLLLAGAINTDTNDYATAEIIAGDIIVATTHGTSVDYAIGDVMSEADVQILITFNAANAGSEVYTSLQITSTPIAVQTYCDVNSLYYGPRETQMLVSLGCNFGCTGKVTTTVKLAFEEGSGYDLKQKEFLNQGNTGAGPYRNSGLLGLGNNSITYTADAKKKYDQIELGYVNATRGTGGINLVDNNLKTTVAIEVGEDVLRAGIMAVLDALIVPNGFDALADDSAAANPSTTVTVETEGLTPTTDGIG